MEHRRDRAQTRVQAVIGRRTQDVKTETKLRLRIYGLITPLVKSA